ncbi:MAG: HEAT repeat domain-containing protein [Candidatus Wallbacteria bacterium]|nr:HEAT repeat domain-containing protein [Candidatus Wallbacteria bacterium]
MDSETAKTGPGPAELRRHGLRLLARCTEKLAKLANDAEPNMASSAVQALGKIGSPVSVDGLMKLLHVERIAEEAVSALARIEEPELGEKLLAALKTAVPALTASIAAVLWRYPGPGALEALTRLAKHGHSAVRRATLDSLGRLADPQVLPALTAALDEPEEDVVISALKALENVKVEDPTRMAALVNERFEKTASAKVRATMVQIFNGLEGEEILTLMKKALKDDNARVRANAVEVVAAMELPEKRKLGILKPLVVDGQNNRVMGNLAVAFGEIDPKASMQILSQLLNSPEKWERASAVYAARYIRNDRIAGWLTTIFTTEADADVLRNVIESLSYFSGDEVTSCFVKALTHNNPLVRSGAVKSLGRTSDPSIGNYLLTLLEREEDRNVICEALTALGKIADASRIPVVSRFLQHTDLRVQANAIDALMQIGSVEIIPQVEPFLNSSDNRVKANAAVALWRAGNLQVVDELEGMLDGPNIKQRSSAVYAVGEVGESLRDLDNLRRYLLLVSALQEDLQNRRAEETPQPALLGPGSTGRAQERSDGVPDIAPALAPAPVKPAAPLPVQLLEDAMELAASGRPDAALAHLTAAGGGPNPYAAFLQADLHRRRGELAPAIEAFSEVSRESASFVHPHLHLANLLNRSQEIPRSLEEYFGAIAAQLETIAEQVELGRRLLVEKRVNDASLLLKDLVSQMAINPKVHHMAGNEFLRYRCYEEAFRHLARAYLTEPGSAEVVFGLAVACYKTNRFTECRALCKKMETQFGADPVLLKKAQDLGKMIDKAIAEKA